MGEQPLCFSLRPVFIMSLLIFGSSILNSVSSEKGFYRAAVYEHVRFGDISFSSKEIIQKNLQSYELAAKTAALNHADIIVFPEWGLHPHDKQNRSSITGFSEDIPNPKYELRNPCDEKVNFDDRTVLMSLSCMAKENNLFLVANMIDKKKCQSVNTCSAEDKLCHSDEIQCPENGLLYHNTNVVFNRKGELVARYYKRHLYFEYDMNLPLHLENSYFDTDFGEFTTFVCFDLSFKESVEAVQSTGVINVAYPTHWFDHVPFALATSFQQAWAMTNKVNLLAANVHNPGTGTVGSGIYSGRALIYTHNPDGHSKLLISNVPTSLNESLTFDLNPKQYIFKNGTAKLVSSEKSKFQSVCSMNILGLPKDFSKEYRCLPSNVSDYEFVKLTKKNDVLTQCSESFCCTLSYEVDSLDEGYYFGVSGKSFKFYDTHSFGMEACFLARCDSHNNQPCSNFLLHSKASFAYVTLQGNFSTKYVYPYVINSNVYLASANEWSFDGKSIVYKNEKPLIFLGLYGRKYDLDGFV